MYTLRVLIGDKMSKYLQVEKNITYAWPEHNFLLSIIRAKPTAYDWIMNMYIQTYSASFRMGDITDDRISFYPNGGFTNKANMYDLCPFIEKYVIPKSVISNKWGSYTSFLVEQINNGFYCSCKVDRFFLNEEGFHPIYVTGYDIIREVFICYDNFDFGIYGVKEIPFATFEKAYMLMSENYHDPYWDSSFIYKVVDFNFKFNKQILCDLLNSYVNPCKSNNYLEIFINLPNAMYENEVKLGIESYDLLLFNIDASISEKQKIDWRSFYFYSDHKIMMKLRYDYLIQNAYLKPDADIMNNLFFLSRQWNIIKCKCLKYNANQNTDLLKEIRGKVISLIELDKRTIYQLIEALC